MISTTCPVTCLAVYPAKEHILSNDNLGNPPTPVTHALNMKYTRGGAGGVSRLQSHQRESQLLGHTPGVKAVISV